jgi:UDP-glucose 4-epimerase
MNILVTGGAGFIGSHFVDRFLSEGNRVWALDDLRCGGAANLSPDAELVQMDLNGPALGAEMARIRCEAVFHLAGHTDVRASCSQPIFDATENIIATLRLLEAGLETGTRYFCFASSGGAIYGEACSGPQTEEQPEAPVTPYGAAKLAVDKYLRAYSAQRGLKSSSLRFSNAYGPRQGAGGEAGVVAAFSRLLREGRPPRVNGDGLQTRDFVYVADLAEAASLALRQEATGVYNLGTGLETSILDLARSLCVMADADPARVEHAPAVPGEQRRSAIDPSKAARELAWSPRTSLSSGLRATYEWFAAWKDKK